MTKSIRSHLTMAAALLAVTFVSLAGLAQAQSPLRLRATIPFAFYAGETLMPAGQYQVERAANGVMRIVCQEARKSVLVNTFGVSQRFREEAHARLVFNKYGEAYLLSEMWWQDQQEGRKTFTSPIERELAQNGTPVRTTVALQ